MAVRVYHHPRRYRSQFRKMPFGQKFLFLTDATSARAATKIGRNLVMEGFLADGSMQTIVHNPTTDICMWVPGTFLAYR